MAIVVATALDRPAFGGECATRVTGPVVVEVQSCEGIDGRRYLEGKGLRWVRDLDPSAREELFRSYTGMHVRGRVVESKAVRSGPLPEARALIGTTESFFIAGEAPTCSAMDQQNLSGQVEESCCQGGATVPCLLDTSFKLTTPLVVVRSSSPSSPAGAGPPTRHVEEVKGGELYEAKKYREAIKAFEAAGDGLSWVGRVRLAQSYRHLDMCHKAVPILKKVQTADSKGEISAKEQGAARVGTFLLARCYAKLGDSSRATVVLQGYLLDAPKYERELRSSLRHRDFGRIRSSREYEEYRTDADKALAKIRGP